MTTLWSAIIVSVDDIIYLIQKEARRKYRGLKQHSHRVFEGSSKGDPLPFSEDNFVRKVTRAVLDGVCVYCFGPLTIKNISPDHVVPLSQGGRSVPDNLVIVCWPCNKSKGGMPLEDFLALGFTNRV